MRLVAVIPAHLASVRFPRKILYEFEGLPMVEHVRRRALLSPSLDDVYVATCDKEIADIVTDRGGKVIMTANTHTNGTTRVAEAVTNIDCSHVILLQGDEPLLLPAHIDTFAREIMNSPEGYAWNATGPIDSAEELDRHSFVKCAVGINNNILFCFRRSPCFCEYELQSTFVRKILGIIAYRRDFLLELTQIPPSPIEHAEYIEQMRILENGFQLKSVPVTPSLPSVNDPHEADIVIEHLKNDDEQRRLLNKILS